MNNLVSPPTDVHSVRKNKHVNFCVTLKKVKWKSCPALCNPMDCSPPGSSVHGLLCDKVCAESCAYTGEKVFKDKDCYILLARYILSPRGGNGNPLQDSCLENLVDRGALWATVSGVAESGMTEHTLTHVLPGNSRVKVITPSPSECGCIWRRSL